MSFFTKQKSGWEILGDSCVSVLKGAAVVTMAVGAAAVAAEQDRSQRVQDVLDAEDQLARAKARVGLSTNSINMYTISSARDIRVANARRDLSRAESMEAIAFAKWLKSDCFDYYDSKGVLEAARAETRLRKELLTIASRY